MSSWQNQHVSVMVVGYIDISMSFTLLARKRQLVGFRIGQNSMEQDGIEGNRKV